MWSKLCLCFGYYDNKQLILKHKSLFYCLFVIYLFIIDENPCEAPNEILSECLNDQTNDILPSKLINNNLVWYYDIETRSCRSIAHDCIRQSNPNRFISFDLCKSQCIPNVTDIPTQSKPFLFIYLYLN